MAFSGPAGNSSGLRPKEQGFPGEKRLVLTLMPQIRVNPLGRPAPQHLCLGSHMVSCCAFPNSLTGPWALLSKLELHSLSAKWTPLMPYHLFLAQGGG